MRCRQCLRLRQRSRGLRSWCPLLYGRQCQTTRVARRNVLTCRRSSTPGRYAGDAPYPRCEVGERGKGAVRCGDCSGFIVNALLVPYLNDAVKMVWAHFATTDEVDTAMKEGRGLPMGPFELLNVVGNECRRDPVRAYLEFP